MTRRTPTVWASLWRHAGLRARAGASAIESQEMRLSVMLIVSDAAAAVEWYKGALGAAERWNLGGEAGLEVEGGPLFVHEAVPGEGERAQPDGQWPDDDADRGVHGRPGAADRSGCRCWSDGRRAGDRPPGALGNPSAGRLHGPVWAPVVRGRSDTPRAVPALRTRSDCGAIARIIEPRRARGGLGSLRGQVRWVPHIRSQNAAVIGTGSGGGV